MGSETKSGVLHIHFGDKTDNDICRISLVEKNTAEHCKKQFGHIQWITCLGMTGYMSTSKTAMETLLGLAHLQLVVRKETRQATYSLHCSCYLKNQTGDILLFSRWQRKISQFYWPLEVFDWKYLVEYPSREIWLSEAEAWLPFDGLKFYTDGSLFESRVASGVFFGRT
jgi:hypothetical protein